MCIKIFVGINFFSQGKKVMANGLENTSNTFVGNSNVGWTKNGTKRLRYILLLKNGAVSPYLLSDTFIQELTLHMGK